MKNKMKIPVIALRGPAILPNTNIHLELIDPSAINAIQYAKDNDCEVLVVAQKNTKNDDASFENIYTVGTIGKCKESVKLSDKCYRVLFEGEERGLIVSYNEKEGFYEGEISLLSCYNATTNRSKAFHAQIKELLPIYFEKNLKLPNEVKKVVKSQLDPNVLCNMIGQMSASINKQTLIEENNTEVRLEMVCNGLLEDIEVAKIELEISRKIETQARGMEREALIRAQIKALQDQLDEDEEDELLQKLEVLEAPEDILKKLKKDYQKLNKMQSSSQEANMLRNYLEFALNLPWGKYDEAREDLKYARKVLDEDHFGIEKVKERILEFLAVRILSGDNARGAILCLVGAPGVGKTSVAKSIAKATGKKYVQMSLGGIRDEAEIRGHRKTYLGAMCGRILSSINQSGVSNPLFLLDEIDKLTSDMRGDPSSALLEVLDPAQNKNFRDNFLELPYDLSQVMFIATANSLDNIQKPLLDRMEVIEMSGYTAEEKLEIAKRYLVPKKIKENGITSVKLSFDDEAILAIIDGYTREAGVRNLERKIDSICRKIAHGLLENNIKKVNVTKDNLNDYLGVGAEKSISADYITSEGIATGLAWTSVGGETLYIEANMCKGSGKLTLTGKLGEVMQESAKTALSFVRANAQEFNIEEEIFEKNDLHIHVPEGAIPKDGPSAGITIATAIVSALTQKKVKSDVAMTGEITLRGRVLPIGGLKEKALAGMRSGIKTILIPEGNKKDLAELPKSLRDAIKFIAVSDAREVISTALN